MTLEEIQPILRRLFAAFPSQGASDTATMADRIGVYHEKLGCAFTVPALSMWLDYYLGPKPYDDGLVGSDGHFQAHKLGGWSPNESRFLPTPDEIIASASTMVRNGLDRVRMGYSGRSEKVRLAALNEWIDPGSLDRDIRGIIADRVLDLPAEERTTEALRRIAQEVRTDNTPERVAERRRKQAPTRTVQFDYDGRLARSEVEARDAGYLDAPGDPRRPGWTKDEKAEAKQLPAPKPAQTEGLLAEIKAEVREPVRVIAGGLKW